MAAGWVNITEFNKLKRKIENMVVDGGEVMQDDEALHIAVDESEASNSAYRPAIIKSGEKGLYTVDILDENGEVVESNVKIFTDMATGYDLPENTSISTYQRVVETLGVS